MSQSSPITPNIDTINPPFPPGAHLFPEASVLEQAARTDASPGPVGHGSSVALCNVTLGLGGVQALSQGNFAWSKGRVVVTFVLAAHERIWPHSAAYYSLMVAN
jgi:hypothetical protein